MYHPKELPGLRSDPWSPVRTTRIQLNSDLWFDQECYLLHRHDGTLPLTGREALLLSRLLEAPHRFHSTAYLSRALARPGETVLDAHRVEQIVSNVRRKLGELPRHPRLLLNRRGVGYCLFLQETIQ